MTATLETEVLDHSVDSVDNDERQYLTGLRLAIVLGSVTLVCFLVLLDMSILGTVSSTYEQITCHLPLTQSGYPTNHYRVQCTA